jgi:hypothetical protein
VLCQLSYSHHPFAIIAIVPLTCSTAAGAAETLRKEDCYGISKTRLADIGPFSSTPSLGGSLQPSTFSRQSSIPYGRRALAMILPALAISGFCKSTTAIHWPPRCCSNTISPPNMWAAISGGTSRW